MKTALFAALLGSSLACFGQTATPIPDTPPAKPAAAAPAAPAASAPQATVTVKPTVPPKPMSSARKARREEDARHCLDKGSNTEIIKCAEAYL